MSKIFVPNLVTFAQIKLEKFKGAAKKSRKMNIFRKCNLKNNVWQHRFRLVFHTKKQYVGKNMFSKVFSWFTLPFSSFWVHYRFYFPESPSIIHPEILITLLSLSLGKSVFLVLILYSLLCLLYSLLIPFSGFHLGTGTHPHTVISTFSMTVCFTEALLLKFKVAEEALHSSFPMPLVFWTFK